MRNSTRQGERKNSVNKETYEKHALILSTCNFSRTTYQVKIHRFLKDFLAHSTQGFNSSSATPNFNC